MANELKYARVRSLLRRRNRNRAMAASPIDSSTNPMATPAISQRNSERVDVVRSTASAKGRGICPRLYVVQRGKANALGKGWVRSPRLDVIRSDSGGRRFYLCGRNRDESVQRASYRSVVIPESAAKSNRVSYSGAILYVPIWCYGCLSPCITHS